MSYRRAAVLVWTMSVEAVSVDILARWRKSLSPDERGRADRLADASGRRNYVAAHALLRCLLQTINSKPACDWEFDRTDRGKIEPVGGMTNGLQCSLTHADNFVACAVSTKFPVGIDAECQRKRVADHVANTVLTPSELKLMRSAPSALRHETFLKLWTLREAHVKATGRGLHFPTEEFAFTLDPLGIQFPDGFPAERAFEWHLLNWTTKKYVLSLAVHSQHAQPVSVIKRAVSQRRLTSMLDGEVSRAQRRAGRRRIRSNMQSGMR